MNNEQQLFLSTIERSDLNLIQHPTVQKLIKVARPFHTDDLAYTKFRIHRSEVELNLLKELELFFFEYSASYLGFYVNENGEMLHTSSRKILSGLLQITEKLGYFTVYVPLCNCQEYAQITTDKKLHDITCRLRFHLLKMEG